MKTEKTKKLPIAKTVAEVAKDTKSFRRYDLTGDIKGILYLPKDSPEKVLVKVYAKS